MKQFLNLIFLFNLVDLISSQGFQIEDLIEIRADIKDAIDQNYGVVALESTIITHGMPYPTNVETALKVEKTILENGAIPATIGIINGIIKVGLTSSEIQYLGSQKPSNNLIKISVRDLPYALSQKIDGGTTVASTSWIAKKVGIQIFVTGGIGGVHRNLDPQNHIFDISADLTELARTGITVVCGGVKSILDIQNTLEYLETHSVTVGTFNSTDFPAFFTKDSGYKSPYNFDSIEKIINLIKVSEELELNRAILIANPIPTEIISSSDVTQAIDNALISAKKDSIVGKQVTPFLLNKINQITDGKSLEANVELIINNAKLGAQIAQGLSQISKYEVTEAQSYSNNCEDKFSVLIFGAIISDIISSPQNSTFIARSSNPGQINFSNGGVARNIAEGCSRLNVESTLISKVGFDFLGNNLIENLKQLNVNTQFIKKEKDFSTALYNAILDENGDMIGAISDTKILESMTPEFIEKHSDLISKSKMVVFDANLNLDTMKTLANLSHKYKIPILFEPTSDPKSIKIFEAEIVDLISIITPNCGEFLQILKKLDSNMNSDFDCQNNNHIQESMNKIFSKTKIETVILSRGNQGVTLATNQNQKISIQNFKALKPKKVKNVTGAGDSLVSGLLYGLSLSLNFEESIPYGITAATMSLESTEPISNKLNTESIHNLVDQYQK